MLKRPLIGVSTWTFGELPLADIVRRMAVLGFDGVELLGDLSRYSAAQAGRILSDHGLSVFSLSPVNVDLAHPDPATRQTAIDYYLRLLDFAAELGGPLVSCRGYVGRVRPLASQSEELRLLIASLQEIAGAAGHRNLRLAFELLNRYESFLANNVVAGLDLLKHTDKLNVGLLLSAYHMNIEEQDAPGVIRLAGDKLWLYHMADSNRQGIGRGHIKFADHLWALEDIGYAGPIILEFTAPGPDPFTATKDVNSVHWLENSLSESLQWF